MRFNGKVAVVTGGASGIGLATVRRFASEGAKVVIADLQEMKAKAAAEEIESKQGGKLRGMGCDVGKEAEVEETVKKTIEEFGSIDIVVNNAGLMIFKPLEQSSTEDWLSVLQVDLLGAFYFTKQAFLHMKKGGAIVNVSSIHAIETSPLVAAYAAAKAAVLSLTRSAALEGKPKGIRVNAVLPGAVDTPMLWNNPNVKAGLEHIERTDVGKPEDIAEVIAFLAAPEAEFIQGSAITVDGGRLGEL